MVVGRTPSLCVRPSPFLPILLALLTSRFSPQRLERGPPPRLRLRQRLLPRHLQQLHPQVLACLPPLPPSNLSSHNPLANLSSNCRRHHHLRPPALPSLHLPLPTPRPLTPNQPRQRHPPPPPHPSRDAPRPHSTHVRLPPPERNQLLGRLRGLCEERVQGGRQVLRRARLAGDCSSLEEGYHKVRLSRPFTSTVPRKTDARARATVPKARSRELSSAQLPPPPSSPSPSAPPGLRSASSNNTSPIRSSPRSGSTSRSVRPFPCLPSVPLY